MKLIIIGAGPGGYETAVEAAARGVETVIIEAAAPGGTCLNAGCIPTKALCRSARLLDDLKEAVSFGVCDLSWKFDFAAAIKRKDEVVSQLRSGVEALMKHKLITYMRGKASFVDARTVAVETEEGVTEVSGDYILVATGSEPAFLPIPGTDLPGVVTSNEILSLETLPESLCVIGGGVIGLEFASVFNSFGCKVSVLEYCREILPRFDSDIAKRLKQSLSKKGIEIITQAKVTEICSAEGGGLEVKYEKRGAPASSAASMVLMAVGRKPAIGSLNFADVGIETTPRGVVVDANMRTTVPTVYAAGDIAGGMMLAHTATYQGLKALNHIMGKEDEIDLGIVPAAVFTSPEAASVGLSEDACKEAGIAVVTYKSFFRANGKAVSMGEPDGLCKIVVSAENGKILGCHLFGAHSADIVQEVGALMNCGATVDKLRSIIHAHPTLSEVLSAAVR
ncbi:MAG: dihydrolipoyl dehydrogenase [Candidatus Cryptobacteroides sp.]